MKRTIGIVVLGLITLATAAYVGTQLWAQAPAGGGVKPASATTPASTGKTRVAILNLKFVVTKYNKWVAFQDQYKAEYKTFEDRVMPLKTRLEDLAKQMQEGKVEGEKRTAAEKEARNLKMQLTDIDQEARDKLGKKESDMMVTIYNEVAAACNRYAQAHDIDLIMHYNDGATAAEMNQPQNIQRKIVSGPCTPVFWKAGVDISADIVQTLNASYPAPAGGGAKPGN